MYIRGPTVENEDKKNTQNKEGTNFGSNVAGVNRQVAGNEADSVVFPFHDDHLDMSTK